MENKPSERKYLRFLMMQPICPKCNSQSRRTEILVAHLRSPCNSTKYYCHDCKKNFILKKINL